MNTSLTKEKRLPLIVRFRPKSLIAFFALVFVLHEFHEQFHAWAIWLRCGCWGQRDLLNWELCGNCTPASDQAFVAFAGPLLNYSVAWIGIFLLYRKKEEHLRSLGLALVFAALPLVRMWGTAQGGGDEGNGLRWLLHGHHVSSYMIRVVGFLTTVVLCGLPLYLAFRQMAGKYKIFVFAAFCFIPIWADRFLVGKFLNGVMTGDDEGRIAGAVPGVYVWFAFTIIILVVSFKGLYRLAEIRKRNLIHADKETSISTER